MHLWQYGCRPQTMMLRLGTRLPYSLRAPVLPCPATPYPTGSPLSRLRRKGVCVGFAPDLALSLPYWNPYRPALIPATVRMVVQGVGVSCGTHIWAHGANTHFTMLADYRGPNLWEAPSMNTRSAANSSFRPHRQGALAILPESRRLSGPHPITKL
jgi:hypothetical protein